MSVEELPKQFIGEVDVQGSKHYEVIEKVAV